MSFIPSKNLHDIFTKYDGSSKLHLNPGEYGKFINEVITSYPNAKDIKIMLDVKLKDNEEITLDDIDEANKLMDSLHIKEQIASPSTEIIKLLKELKESKELNDEDKKLLDWGIVAILDDKIYKTELCEDISKPINKERKSRLSWMEVLSSPEFSPSKVNSNIENLKQKDSSIFTIEIPPAGLELLKLFDTIDFDIFEYEKAVGRKLVLPSIAYKVLETNNVLSYLDSEKLENFLYKIRDGYIESNPYHNDIHASDVTQLINYFLKSGIREIVQLSDIDVLSLIISAIAHDFRHPGVNNVYLVNSNDDLALLYNDQSILENYHTSEVFKLLWRDPDCNIFNKLNESEQKLIRKRITGLILSTDNAKHFYHMTWLDRMISGLGISKGKNTENIINKSSSASEFDSKQSIMMILIHLADISNPTRPFKLAREWGIRVTTEFYLQGDKEKERNLQVSMGCDKEKGNLPKSQMGFISALARSYVEKVVNIFPVLQPMLDNISRGYQEWDRLAKEMESK